MTDTYSFHGLLHWATHRTPRVPAVKAGALADGTVVEGVDPAIATVPGTAIETAWQHSDPPGPRLVVVP